jgi:hypothetical protein
MECLNNIVGLSRTECECQVAEIPTVDQESTSGIYIDEVEGGLKLSAIESMDCQTFVDKAKQARKRAIDMFTEQIIGVYSTSPYRRRFRPFNSRIAKVNSLRLLNVPQFAGLRLRTNLTRGSYLIIDKIGLIIEREESVTLNIYRTYRDDHYGIPEKVAEITGIETIANLPSIKTLDAPLSLPLYDDQLKAIDYSFIYDTVLYGQPRDNSASCSCGGSEQILKTYLMPQGVSASTIEGIATGGSSSYANGIFIDGRIDCQMQDIICQMLQMDQSKTIANAIAYKAQEMLIEDLMGSGNINRYTMLSSEHLWGKRNHFRKEFDDRLLWLTQTIPVEHLSDCLACDDNRIARTLIR